MEWTRSGPSPGWGRSADGGGAGAEVSEGTGVQGLTGPNCGIFGAGADYDTSPLTNEINSIIIERIEPRTSVAPQYHTLCNPWTGLFQARTYNYGLEVTILILSLWRFG
jgi:hypothetical protein